MCTKFINIYKRKFKFLKDLATSSSEERKITQLKIKRRQLMEIIKIKQAMKRYTEKLILM
jgi:hypothetical protein